MLKYAKALCAIAGACITAAAGLGLTGKWQSGLTVAAAAVTAASVYLVPNQTDAPAK